VIVMRRRRRRPAALAGMISPVRAVPWRARHPRLEYTRHYVWTCDDARLRSVKLQNRERPEQTAIVHPSTKRPGLWQATWFDHDVPTGDFQVDTCREALREFPPSRWRLRKVLAR
jgi:hypothetical protein